MANNFTEILFYYLSVEVSLWEISLEITFLKLLGGFWLEFLGGGDKGVYGCGKLLQNAEL